MAREVFDARGQVGHGDARGELLADPLREGQVAPRHGSRHLPVERSEARGREQSEGQEEARPGPEEPALERGVAAGEAGREAQADGGEDEQAREGPHQVAVEVDAHEDVGRDEQTHEADDREPPPKGGAQRLRGAQDREQDEE